MRDGEDAADAMAYARLAYKMSRHVDNAQEGADRLFHYAKRVRDQERRSAAFRRDSPSKVIDLEPGEWSAK